MPLMIPSTAWSSAASSKMTFAAFPPSSSVSFLPVPASSRWIALPTSVEPVNATLSTSSCVTSAAPVRPSPVTMLTTPGGNSAWRTTSQKSSAVSGVVSAGLSTTVFPAASAGAIFHASISRGKFHGMIWPGLGLAKWKRARFVISSTSEVYGDPQVHPQPETYWGNVNPIGPRGVYDEAKRYAEAMTMTYHTQQGVDTCIARIFNTYG